MFDCRDQFVEQIYWPNDINQLIAKAKTAVVVKKSPTAAVAVNSDKFIARTFSKKNNNYFVALMLYQKILLFINLIQCQFQNLLRKKKASHL